MLWKLLILMPAWLVSVSALSNDDENRDITNEYFIIIEKSSTILGKENYQKNLNKMRELEHSIIDVGGLVLNKYYLVFTGIHAHLSEQALSQVRTFNGVLVIHPNQHADLIPDQVVNPDPNSLASWGLDRIDQRALPLDGSFSAPMGDFTVHAYVIDSGIRQTHAEFANRLGDGMSTVSNPSIEDCLGHGTHVAGTILGANVGVSANTIVHPVRVFGCNAATTFDAILKGLEWVIANHKKPAVANMSLGASTDVDVIDVAVRNCVVSGVTVVVAAGNSAQSACYFSPAREPSAITVAASSINDARADFSNFGPCVDVFAPGEDIVSSYHTHDSAYAVLSGTSMATPHVCGATALVSSLHPTWTPEQVANEIINKATEHIISDVRGAPNLLLHVADFAAKK